MIEHSGARELATTVALVALRGPAPLAKTLAALDVLSDGRVVARVGPGSSERDYDAVGVHFEERWATLMVVSFGDPAGVVVSMRTTARPVGSVPSQAPALSPPSRAQVSSLVAGCRPAPTLELHPLPRRGGRRSSWREERAAAYGIRPDELDEHYRKRTTRGVNIYPQDIAEAVLHFASPVRSGKSTGNLLNVDGGRARGLLALSEVRVRRTPQRCLSLSGS